MNDHNFTDPVDTTGGTTTQDYFVYTNFDPASTVDHLTFANHILQSMRSYDLEKQNEILNHLRAEMIKERTQLVEKMKKDLEFTQQMLDEINSRKK